MLTPMRNRIGASGARCNASAHATASLARANANTKLSPSPCSTGRTPPWNADEVDQYPIEPRDRRPHRVGLGLPQPCRALDVRQQHVTVPVGRPLTARSLHSVALMLASMRPAVRQNISVCAYIYDPPMRKYDLRPIL